MPDRPADWPTAGQIDLARHDPPHASALTEWWYLHTHLETVDGRKLALFASFFRQAQERDEETGELIYAHSMTWAMSDLDRGEFYSDSLVDPAAPELGLRQLDSGRGTDERLRRALREILERGTVPYPDRLLERAPFVHRRRLDLDFDGNVLRRLDDGSYALKLWHEYFKCGCDLVFRPTKPAIRHGADGLVQSHDGAEMFYYFVPRCEVTGVVLLDARRVPVATGSGWYDHEFGGFHEEDATPNDHIAWNWVAAQLEGGIDVSAYAIEDVKTQELLDRCLVIVDADGGRRQLNELTFEASGRWTSVRTFNGYPTRWTLSAPEAGLELTIEAAFPNQEFVTLISKPAFWEGRCEVTGTLDGAPVRGHAYVERSGFAENETLDDFFRAVGKTVRASVAAILPFEPTFEDVRDLVASEEREHYMEGVDIPQFVDTGVRPVRAITDRGGKGWRSYAALACCDVVGGESPRYAHWLAMPELMHVGSLIVDDVQDRSTIRRGGPPCHAEYGDAIAINAGTSCYFMGQKLLASRKNDISDSDRVRLYDLYFEALRAGHAGQAADIDGLDRFVPAVVESGDATDLEAKVLGIHRMKTAAPAAALARMGAIVGGGTEAQVEGLGRYFESLGLAFQIVDDVLNLRGFERGLKVRGEDISHGKVTLPVAKALAILDREGRAWLWDEVSAKTDDAARVAAVIERLEGCGAVRACEEQANTLIEDAWSAVHPLLEESIVKMMLRAFGWYVLERHY